MVSLLGLVEGYFGLAGTPATILVLIIIFVGAELLTKLVHFFMTRGLQKRMEATAFKLMERVIRSFIFIGVLFLIFGIFGAERWVVPLLTSAGIIGIVLGFALKDTLSNIFAGLSLFMDKPFKIGQVVEIGEIIGNLEDIGFRSVKIKTFDNKRVMIPNSIVANSNIFNYSIEDPKLRIDVQVSISYKSDLEKAVKVLNEVAEKKDFILNDPKSVVVVNKFADSGIELKLRAWIPTPDLLFTAPSDLRRAIKLAFKKEGIEIPFPQMDVHMDKK